MENNEVDNAAVKYSQLVPKLKADMEKENQSSAGVILFSLAVLGSAGFLRWKAVV